MDMIDVIKRAKLVAEGGMSDIHIGAQEFVGNYVDDDGNLKAPKDQVLKAMNIEMAKAPFPQSYEIETAIKMVADKFDDNGQSVDEPDEMSAGSELPARPEAEEPEVTEEPAKEDMWGNTGTKAFFNMGSKLDIEFSMEQKGMMAGVLNRLDQDVLSKAVDEYKSQELDPDQAEDDGGRAQNAYKLARDQGEVESKELNTEAMKKEDKKPVNEAIQISTDSPEEAGMMMQILKLAGVQQVDQDMISQGEPEAEENPEHGEPGHVCGAEDDAVGSNDMAKMRDMITAPDEEKAEENFANSEKEAERDLPKTMDTDTLVNVHSGGLNKQKQQVRKEYPGDNPLAVKYETKEDTITEEELANSFRTQYEDFKKSYQEAAKPDFLDMDKDGNKKEPMKKAAKDKEAK